MENSHNSYFHFNALFTTQRKCAEKGSYLLSCMPQRQMVYSQHSILNLNTFLYLLQYHDNGETPRLPEKVQSYACLKSLFPTSVGFG